LLEVNRISIRPQILQDSCAPYILKIRTMQDL
jgi:hypothetical protein